MSLGFLILFSAVLFHVIIFHYSLNCFLRVLPHLVNFCHLENFLKWLKCLVFKSPFLHIYKIITVKNFNSCA